MMQITSNSGKGQLATYAERQHSAHRRSAVSSPVGEVWVFLPHQSTAIYW